MFITSIFMRIEENYVLISEHTAIILVISLSGYLSKAASTDSLIQTDSERNIVDL